MKRIKDEEPARAKPGEKEEPARAKPGDRGNWNQVGEDEWIDEVRHTQHVYSTRH